MQFRGASDEAPSLGGFLHSAEEAEEQEDVTVADALLIQVALRDASLAEHASPLLPGRSALPVSVRVEVQVGVEVDVVPSPDAAVGDADDDAGDVDVAVLEVIEGHGIAGGYGQREHGAVGEDGTGAASGSRIKALAADDQFSRLQCFPSGFRLCARVAST